MDGVSNWRNQLNSFYTITTSMMHQFQPFTADAFNQQTGLNAFENEAIFIRWVNTQINYANFVQMQAMNESLKEIVSILKEGAFVGTTK
jgi:hypothetical protein